MYKVIKVRTPGDLCRYCGNQVWDKVLNGFHCTSNGKPFQGVQGEVSCHRFARPEYRFRLYPLADALRRVPMEQLGSTREGAEEALRRARIRIGV
jgi:hypothetical protein